MAKRIFDITLSAIGLILFCPFFIIISIFILADTKGGVLFFQKRVGKNNTDFNLIKFRSMYALSDELGLITIGDNDSRITKVGRWLRKYKIDELPQLINILKNDMSFVGPRPEVRKYVSLYTEEQKQVLSVKPGLTDYASLEYLNENEILTQYPDPEKAYVDHIMQAKLLLNLKYISERTFLTDLKIIWDTIRRIGRNRQLLVNPKL